jgi:GMP synthase (glutamine-hydrolysing)
MSRSHFKFPRDNRRKTVITIVDCGSQLTQNIARKIRELDFYAKIVPYNTPAEKVLEEKPAGIIISGGPFSVYDEGSPLYDVALLEAGIPVLGICFGMQSIAHLLGGKVKPTEVREYGGTIINVQKTNPLVRPEHSTIGGMSVWMSHGDIVEEPPKGFEVLAKSLKGHIAAMRKDHIYAVQYHPEVSHSEGGRRLLYDFAKEVCNCEQNWDQSKRYYDMVYALKEQIEGKVVIAGVSGGVDSTAMAVLLDQIAHKNFHPIFINNGLLRQGESEEVMGMFKRLGLEVTYADHTDRFLKALRGVVDPEVKRKIIGEQFIESFKEVAKSIPNATCLAQGTLYPDVIESVPIFGSSDKIKSHHNVGGLPEDLDYELVEPFRELFKDEVRELAQFRLRIPRDIVYRHPFPGPGLAVRIIGDITEEKLEILRQADAIFIEELRRKNLYNQIGQAFAVLTNTSTVGVKGDAHSYEAVIALRAVTTQDYMTADWFDFDHAHLRTISYRIINEVKGVNRVVYDISQKPPSTIEWE